MTQYHHHDHHVEAVALNNAAVSFLEEGKTFKAFEAMTIAIAALDDEFSQPHIPFPENRKEMEGEKSRVLQQKEEYVSSCTSVASSTNSSSSASSLSSLDQGNSSRNDNSNNSMDIDGKSIHNLALSRAAGDCAGCLYHWVEFGHAVGQDPPYSSNAPKSSLSFLCLHAVQITLVSLHDEDDEEDYATRCRAIRWVCLFNLAITNHLMAMSLGERGQFLLKKAHHCYTEAQMTAPELANFNDILRLVLCTQNNQMTIYNEFGMSLESKSCVQLLSNLIFSLPQHPDRINLDKHILLNLFVLSRTETAAAA